jgi:hypothetical protein
MAPETPAAPLDAEAMHAAGLAAAAALPPDEPAAGATPQATPEGTQGQTATAPADSFTRLDPNTLPAEVRPYYESMQGDYTRKTQEVAQVRQLQEELGLDETGLRSAAELYSALQDPQQLVSFYNELTSALEANGLSPAQAAAAATEHIQGATQPGEDPELMDPEDRRIAAVEAKLAAFEQQQAQADAQRQREAQQMAFVAEMNRQEQLVKETYPSWTQEDIDMVYAASGGGQISLMEAASNIAAYTASKVARILDGKGAVQAGAAHTQLPPALAGTTRPQGFGDDLEAAHRAALEAARLLP